MSALRQPVVLAQLIGRPLYVNDALRVFALLALQHAFGQVVQRHVEIFAAFRILGRDPDGPALEVNVGPAQAGYVALPEPRRECEQYGVTLTLIGVRCVKIVFV